MRRLSDSVTRPAFRPIAFGAKSPFMEISTLIMPLTGTRTSGPLNAANQDLDLIGTAALDESFRHPPRKHA